MLHFYFFLIDNIFQKYTGKSPSTKSLKSLMGHNDDDEDLNGELDDNELNEKDDSDSDYEATPSKKSRLKKSSKFKGHKSK